MIEQEKFDERLKAISNEELIKMARDVITALCKSGGRAFTMTVPPRIGDTDVLFTELIDRLEGESHRMGRFAKWLDDRYTKVNGAWYPGELSTKQLIDLFLKSQEK